MARGLQTRAGAPSPKPSFKSPPRRPEVQSRKSCGLPGEPNRPRAAVPTPPPPSPRGSLLRFSPLPSHQRPPPPRRPEFSRTVWPPPPPPGTSRLLSVQEGDRPRGIQGWPRMALTGLPSLPCVPGAGVPWRPRSAAGTPPPLPVATEVVYWSVGRRHGWLSQAADPPGTPGGPGPRARGPLGLGEFATL
ncbi:WAS/WASL-interacting protein family member 1-like [Delphinus delphis]|uniref:WAS/WASL-interacting protein family member 1-like n=1 Tax=Delphinus delphis TaxID=9728 RepID=UPI003753008A